jgi:hypothetical protein
MLDSEHLFPILASYGFPKFPSQQELRRERKKPETMYFVALNKVLRFFGEFLHLHYCRGGRKEGSSGLNAGIWGPRNSELLLVLVPSLVLPMEGVDEVR